MVKSIDYVKNQKPQYDSNHNHSVPHIIACVGVDEYRTTIQQEVRPGDAVPKVGWLSFGDYNSGLGSTKRQSETTTVLDTVPIGVGVGASVIKKAKERDSNVYFAVRDAWKTAELLRIQQNCFIEMKLTMDRPRVGFDIVFVDVGGLFGSDGLLESLLFLSSPSNALPWNQGTLCHYESLCAKACINVNAALAGSQKSPFE